MPFCVGAILMDLKYTVGWAKIPSIKLIPTINDLFVNRIQDYEVPVIRLLLHSRRTDSSTKDK